MLKELMKKNLKVIYGMKWLTRLQKRNLLKLVKMKTLMIKTGTDSRRQRWILQTRKECQLMKEKSKIY